MICYIGKNNERDRAKHTSGPRNSLSAEKSDSPISKSTSVLLFSVGSDE